MGADTPRSGTNKTSIAEFGNNNLDARRSVGSRAANGRGRRGAGERSRAGVSLCLRRGGRGGV